jgi:regulator of cell morphogenesis and NO signaling
MFQTTDTIARIMKQHPAAARVFERHRMDYCCGGGATLADACAERGEDVEALVRELDELLAPKSASADPAEMSLSDLTDHIEATHHAWLREEMPRLDAMTDRVARVHGARNPRLDEIRDVWRGVSETMQAHLAKEEQILFPMIRSLEAADPAEGAPAFHCGSVANPVMQMEREHDAIEDGIARLRELTDGYIAPAWACGTYRAMIEALMAFEADSLVHAAKEEGLLFLRATMAERALAGIPEG